MAHPNPNSQFPTLTCVKIKP